MKGTVRRLSELNVATLGTKVSKTSDANKLALDPEVSGTLLQYVSE